MKLLKLGKEELQNLSYLSDKPRNHSHELFSTTAKEFINALQYSSEITMLMQVCELQALENKRKLLLE
jgi:hypothetical protein